MACTLPLGRCCSKVHLGAVSTFRGCQYVCWPSVHVGPSMHLGGIQKAITSLLALHNEVLRPPLILINTMMGVAGITALPQQQPLVLIGPQARMPTITQAYAYCSVGPPLACSSVSELSLLPVFYVGSIVFAFFFRFLCGQSLHQWGLKHLDLHICDPSEHNHGRYMCLLVFFLGPCQECTE